MRVALIGCVTFSRSCLEALDDIPEVELVGVVSRPPPGGGSDACPLGPAARDRGVPLLEVEGRADADVASFVREVAADLVLCVGWHRLLGPAVLGAAPRGVIGYHPAALPQNRGRHPIIWALALGLPSTASTFLWLDPGVDSGDVLDQRPVTIEDADDAGTLYGKITAVACDQLRDLLPRLAAGEEPRTPQDPARANSWRRRRADDGRIDWRMPSDAIHNLVRALARPYPGAHVVTDRGEVKVWRAEAGPPAAPNLEPGRVLEASPVGVRVRCASGSVWIREHEFPELPPVGSCLP